MNNDEVRCAPCRLGAVFALLMGLGISGTLWLGDLRSAQEADRVSGRRLLGLVQVLVADELHEQEALLETVRSLEASHPGAAIEARQEFVGRLELRKILPSVSWIGRVGCEEFNGELLASLESDALHGASSRWAHLLPEVPEALEQAARTGRVALCGTGSGMLVQACALYKPGTYLALEADRLAGVEGWLVAEIDAPELLLRAFGVLPEGAALALKDEGGQPFGDVVRGNPAGDPHEQGAEIQFGDAVLELQLSAPPSTQFIASRQAANGKFRAGALASMLLAVVVGLALRSLELARRNERDMREAMRAAEAGSTSKREFLNNISHEFRTPLNGIMGGLEGLSGSATTEEQISSLETGKGCARALARMLDSVLEFSELEGENGGLELTDFDLHQLLGRCVEGFRAEALAEGLQLENQATAGPVWVRGPQERLLGALNHLVDNAVKFTSSGSVRVGLSTRDIDEARVGVELVVEDTGIGLDLSETGWMVSPFAQGDSSSTRRFGGVGLGLAIVARTVALLQGELKLESERGIGTTVRVHLELERAKVGQALERGRDYGGTAAKDCVLLVEDNPMNQLVARRHLERLGFRVAVAGDGQQALEQLEERTFDLVLMDCQMPVMDGFEATRSIRGVAAAWRDVPVVAFTAHALASDRERCREAGMDDFLTKPMDLNELQRVLASHGLRAGEDAGDTVAA